MKKEKPRKVDRDENDWKGYSFDELRFQRALALAKLEIEKEKIYTGFQRMYTENPVSKNKGLIRKLLGGLNYMDYGIIAFRLGKSIFRLFRK